MWGISFRLIYTGGMYWFIPVLFLFACGSEAPVKEGTPSTEPAVEEEKEPCPEVEPKEPEKERFRFHPWCEMMRGKIDLEACTEHHKDPKFRQGEWVFIRWEGDRCRALVTSIRWKDNAPAYLVKARCRNDIRLIEIKESELFTPGPKPGARSEQE